ncbi:MAG: RHS repeat-associated core domain-containing protein [Myxococcales bacterium]
MASAWCPASAQAEAGELAPLRWDHQGRVREATVGDHSARYIYGASMDRVLEEHDGSVTYYIGPDFEVRDGIAITYARLGSRRVARRSQPSLQTALLSDVAPGAGPATRIDIGDAWLMSDAGSPMRHLYASARRLLIEHTETAIFLHHDHLESATLASGPAGEVVGQSAFHTSGDVRAYRGYVDAYGFTGQPRDPTTRFVHFTFRELDARAGRWVSPDPLFLRDGRACLQKPFECANGYPYVANNSVDLVDPTGETATVILSADGASNLITQRPDGSTWQLSMDGYATVSAATFPAFGQRAIALVNDPAEWRNQTILLPPTPEGHGGDDQVAKLTMDEMGLCGAFDHQDRLQMVFLSIALSPEQTERVHNAATFISGTSAQSVFMGTYFGRYLNDDVHWLVEHAAKAANPALDFDSSGPWPVDDEMPTQQRHLNRFRNAILASAHGSSTVAAGPH